MRFLLPLVPPTPPRALFVVVVAAAVVACLFVFVFTVRNNKGVGFYRSGNASTSMSLMLRQSRGETVHVS
jgi:hypothetical protein